MKYFVILLVLVGFVGTSHGFEPSMNQAPLSYFGYFDNHGDKVTTLVIGKEYLIKAKFFWSESYSQPYEFFAEINDDKNHKVIERLSVQGTMTPNNELEIEFSWTPKETGEFRNFSELWATNKPSVITGVPQYDFKVMASSPQKQIQSGIIADHIQCNVGLVLIQKIDYSPACVKSESLEKLRERGWAKLLFEIQIQPDQTKQDLTEKSDQIIADLENDTGVITWKNQTYYFDTPHYTDDAYHHLVQIQFHDVNFTLFPSGFRGGLPVHVCDDIIGGSYFWADAKFSDGTNELLHMFVNSPPCPNKIPIIFSNHTNPQAGLTFLDGKLRLLVNVDSIANTNIMDEIPSSEISNQPKSVPLTLFPVTPQNVTLPNTQRITDTTMIPINKINQITITNSDPNGQKTHPAQITIKSATLHPKGIESLSAQSGFDTLVFDYSIQSKDNDAFYASLDFEMQFEAQTYPALLNGDEFSIPLLPDQKRDSSFAIQVGKNVNQITITVKDSVTQKTLWIIPLDLTPYKIKYHTGSSNLIQENEN